jgi:hypothetical protein
LVKITFVLRKGEYFDGFFFQLRFVLLLKVCACRMEEDDDDAPELVAVPTKNKKKRSASTAEPETVSLPPKKKSVSFEGVDNRPSTTASSSAVAEQRARMFAVAGLEAPVTTNKAMRKAQKADKKRRAKESRKEMDVDEDGAGTSAGGAGMPVDDDDAGVDQAYDFKQFFGAAPTLNTIVPDEDEEL